MSSENKVAFTSPAKTLPCQLEGEGDIALNPEDPLHKRTIDDISIRVDNLSKCYHIYDTPRDRLKQFILPRLQRIIRQKPNLYYKDFWAIKDISFEIGKGETVGIIGKNGSGKSTLLQILAGTLSPTTGTVRVSGRLAALLELGAGFNPEFTGRENVFMNGAILGLSRQELESRIDDILSFAEIGDFIDQPVKTYSSGMFVRLAFAIQANVDPDILLVDEALAVGDAYFVHRCMLRFHQLRERGTTILLVTHDATAVKTLCNRAIWLDNGKSAYVGESCDVVDRYMAALKRLPVVVDCCQEKIEDSQELLSDKKDLPEGDETLIPNIDRRHGNQSCSLIGLGLYNEQFQKTNSVKNNSTAMLRLTLKNNSLSEGKFLVIGCSLRNSRGVDIASNNSEIEKTDIRSPKPGQNITVRIKIFFPELHPGSYSFSISIGYRNEKGEMVGADGITNAIVFEIISERLVHVLMSLRSDFIVEGQRENSESTTLL
jgi:lipopolysaccharide transport system ATP-binding protein